MKLLWINPHLNLVLIIFLVLLKNRLQSQQFLQRIIWKTFFIELSFDCKLKSRYADMVMEIELQQREVQECSGFNFVNVFEFCYSIRFYAVNRSTQ